MTFDDMEKSVNELRDNQIVQGYRLGRTESNLDRLEAMVERNAQAIEKLTDGLSLLHAAMKGLAETVDRFIRGMEHDGHRPPDEGPEGAR
jgi:hypothetical protein